MSDETLCNRLEAKYLTFNDILSVQQFCHDHVRCNEFYKLQNDAKLRAVISSKTYKEFRDIVDAAHLKPIRNNDRNEKSGKT